MPENRKLIFRAWDEKAEVMVHGVCPYAEGDHIGFSVDDAEAAYTKDQLEDMPQAEDWYYLLDNFKTMQWVGLKDLKGVLIFDGDISEFAGKRCEVRYWDNMMAFGLYFPCDNKWLHVWDCEDQVLPIEVLGNIYQKPELLTDHPPP